MATVATSAAQREKPRTDVLHWAKRPFSYGPTGQVVQLDRGQAFKLLGLQNDSLLCDLGYVEMVDTGVTTFPCRECGAMFIDQRLRDGHGKRAHEEREYVPPPVPTKHPEESAAMYQNRLDEWAKAAGAAADRHDARDDKILDQVAPIDVTKTAASRQ
jgi:hypothetical protein